MHRAFSQRRLALVWLASPLLLMTTVAADAIGGEPFVEFDFIRVVECRDITPPERMEVYPQQRLVELTLPVSVRFRGVAFDDVDELTVEINGAMAGLRVHEFAPSTQLASDITQPIETTTTTKSGRSLDATLGGALPVPFATKVANVTPSISAGTSSGETMTEKLNRLPPMQAIVVSGTTCEGRGVFYKLKRSSQTSLEGSHEFAVTFVAPAGWRGGEIQVACNARGQRKMLWMKQPATIGREGGFVRLYVANHATVRQVAKPVVYEEAQAQRITPPEPSQKSAGSIQTAVTKAKKPE